MVSRHKNKMMVLVLVIAVLFVAGSLTAHGYSRTLFGTEALSEYDGKANSPAYVSIKGRVYDVTESWSDGTHRGHEAGQNLTDAIQEAGHGMDVLEDLEQVGYYVPKVLTSDELSYYDGQDGREAYVAVEGLIYDVTESWSDGTHRGHEAGQDLTQAFYDSPHDDEILDELSVVGLLAEEDEFSIGDVVEILDPHEEHHRFARVAEIYRGVAYGVMFPGEEKVHRWYVEFELRPAAEEDLEEMEENHEM